MIFENNFFKFSKSLTYPVKMIVFFKKWVRQNQQKQYHFKD